MKSLIEKSKIDNHVMKLLKLSEIRHDIAHTDRGHLQLVLPYEGLPEDYFFYLDSVKQDREKNDQLLKLFNGILYTL